MFGTMRLWIIGVMVAAILGAFGYAYSEYKGLTDKVEQQGKELVKREQQVKDRDLALEVMAQNVVEVEKKHLEDVERTKFNVTVDVKRKAIEKEIQYDKSNSVSIDSARFYLYP